MEAVEGDELKETFIQWITIKIEPIKLPNEESEYLLQVEKSSPKLLIFCIPKKQLKTYELNFTFYNGMGFTHVEKCLYLCGEQGQANWKFNS